MSTDANTPESSATLASETPSAELVDPSSIGATSWTDAIIAFSGLATALATVGLVVGAYFAWKAAKATLDQMKQDSAAQTRPYVHARLERSMGADQGTDLIVTNVGRSTARGLTMEINQWPSREDDVTKALRKMMAWQRDLPPGTQLRTYWDLDATKTKKDGNLGIQIPVVMRMTYCGDDETMPQFEDEYALDTSVNGRTPLGWEGAKTRGQGSVANRLNEVVRALSELRRNQ